jgi:hypothetical protein
MTDEIITEKTFTRHAERRVSLETPMNRHAPDTAARTSSSDSRAVKVLGYYHLHLREGGVKNPEVKIE